MNSYLISILLVIMPIVFSVLYVIKENTSYRNIVSIIMFITMSVFSIMLVFNGTGNIMVPEKLSKLIEFIMEMGEIFIVIYLFCVTLKHKRWVGVILTVIQSSVMVLSKITVPSHLNETTFIGIDMLSIVMLLIVNIIGSLILVFANDYMVHYEEEKGLKNRKKTFYFTICLFLAAMNGIILSDQLNWIYFFWEITTITSFILISYNNDEEALNNGFRALVLNLFGGLCFSIGIFIFVNKYGIYSMSQIIDMGNSGMKYILPVFLLCIAGFVKSAQVPFQSWLLGAMVAPTPVSALLHSSTMVKAGVYLIIKLSPAYSGTWLGIAIAVFGGFTFFICSLIGISQRNAKRILAYSTIANLGLIIASAGIGTGIALSAAMLLLIFHAVSKALLFLCVGQIEHIIGSRDIEEMNGLIKRAPFVTLLAVLGMLSMLVPPFGVMITKWISLESAAGNPYVTILLVLGSACMSVMWIRWIGTILAYPGGEIEKKYKPGFTVLFPLSFLGISIIVTSIYTDYILNNFVNPEVTKLLKSSSQITGSMGILNGQTGSFNYYLVMLIAVATCIVYIIASKVLFNDSKMVKMYLCGENNSQSNIHFRNPMGEYDRAKVSNFYMLWLLKEDRLTKAANAVSVIILLLILTGGLL